MAAKRATAKKSAAKRSTAKKAAARKTTARKTAARKTSARKAAPRKAAARKTTAKKRATKRAAAKKSTAKRSAAKRPAAKKAAKRSAAKKATKKSAARKTTAKKAAKKSAARKTTARKTTKKATTKKAAAKKAAAKKSVAKKAAAKRSPAAKKAVPRAATQGITGAAPDALEVLMSDHREVEQLFSQLESAAPDSNVAQDIANKIVRELSIHAVAEEQVLYPAARREIDEGEVNHAIDEHQEVKELLAKVDGRSPAEDEVMRTFKEIKSSVEEHVQEEENEMFPKLRDRLGQERLQEMGEQLESAKRLAPTHPHPNAPNTPPANVVAGLGASVVDRIRDRARGRNKE